MERDWARRHHSKWVEADERSATAAVHDAGAPGDRIAAQLEEARGRD